MENLRTTVAGVVAGVAQLLKIYDINIPPEIFDAVTAVAVAAMGVLAKDAPRGATQ